jgi:hypothetical protein
MLQSQHQLQQGSSSYYAEADTARQLGGTTSKNQRNALVALVLLFQIL